MTKQLQLEDLNLGQEQWTPEQADQSQQQIQAALAEANLPSEMLAEIGQWAQKVITDPSQFPAFQQWLRDQGLPEEDIPQEPDYQELTAMVAIGHVAGGMQAQEPVTPAAEPAGPVSPEQLQAMAGQGRMGDTQLAHINSEEAAVLKSMGGVGTINPATGLPEYGFFSDLWKGIKKVVKKVAPFVLPVVALAFPALLPAIGTTLGASAALAPVVGAAVVAGGVTALSGGSIKEVLSSAALTGLGAYLTPIVGKYVGNMVGVTAPTIQSAIGSATLAGGLTALRGGTVSQILTAAATGGAANYLGTIASNAINGGGITNAKITQKQFDDAVFAAADAKGLADAGISQGQIAKILTDSGLNTQVAQTAASLATAGNNADQIATALSNTYGGMTVGGQKSLYTGGATGVEKSIIGGANVKALESVQQAEDALFIAERARMTKETLAANGITGRAAQPAIQQDLVAMGVDSRVAAYAADSIISNYTPGQIASGISNSRTFAATTLIGEPPATIPATSQAAAAIAAGTPAPTATAPVPVSPAQQARLDDAAFLAADAKQLAAQGLGQDQIQSTLVSSGATQNAAYQATVGAMRGQSVDTITDALARQQFDLFATRPNTVAEIAPGGGTGPAQPQASTEVVEVDVTQPATQPATQQPASNLPLGGNVTEAEFIAADAVQLAQQTNNNAAAVQQNLEYAGVDPVVAAEAANLAVSGINAETIALTIGGVPGPTGQPSTGGSLYTNEPGAFTSQGLGEPPATYFPPAGSEQPAAQPEGPGYDTGAIIATPAIPNPLETPEPPQRPDMGTFTPAAPDPSWSIPLQYPGMNPGLVGAGIRPAYQTTSPVQSQYYWGRQPFFATAEELGRYGTSPFQPAQPFGIQQGFFEQPMGTPPTPVYGANLQPIAPQQLPTAGQIGGNEPLNQPIGAQQPVTPYEVNPYLMPASFAEFQQPMLPYNMYQLPAQPNYVYNIAPQVGQYTVPAAAPVAA